MSLLSLSIRCHYFMSVSHGIRATSHCSCYFGSNNEIGSSVFTCVKSALTFASLGGAGQTPTLWFSFRRNLINMPRRVTFLIWTLFWDLQKQDANISKCDQKLVCWPFFLTQWEVFLPKETKAALWRHSWPLPLLQTYQLSSARKQS